MDLLPPPTYFKFISKLSSYLYILSTFSLSLFFSLFVRFSPCSSFLMIPLLFLFLLLVLSFLALRAYSIYASIPFLFPSSNLNSFFILFDSYIYFPLSPSPPLSLFHSPSPSPNSLYLSFSSTPQSLSSPSSLPLPVFLPFLRLPASHNLPLLPFPSPNPISLIFVPNLIVQMVHKHSARCSLQFISWNAVVQR